MKGGEEREMGEGEREGKRRNGGSRREVEEFGIIWR